MRVVFVGTPEFAATVLSALLDAEREIVGVVTQPDRPQGRRRRLTLSPVKTLAVKHGLRVLQPSNINDNVAAVEELTPDVLVVAAYGQKLSHAVLNAPRRMPVNVHPSLLPRWRGAAPIPWAIMSGDREAGVSIIRMTEKMDAGDILAQEALTIGPNETAGELSDRLARASGPLLTRVLKKIEEGTISLRPQPDEGVTFALRLEKQDGALDWSLPAGALSRRIRGLTPLPGAYTFLKTSSRKPERLVIIEAKADRETAAAGNAGEILSASPAGIVAAAGEGTLRILHLQPAGRRAMSVADFLNGRTVRPGDHFVRII